MKKILGIFFLFFTCNVHFTIEINLKSYSKTFETSGNNNDFISLDIDHSKEINTSIEKLKKDDEIKTLKNAKKELNAINLDNYNNHKVDRKVENNLEIKNKSKNSLKLNSNLTKQISKNEVKTKNSDFVFSNHSKTKDNRVVAKTCNISNCVNCVSKYEENIEKLQKTENTLNEIQPQKRHLSSSASKKFRFNNKENTIDDYICKQCHSDFILHQNKCIGKLK